MRKSKRIAKAKRKYEYTMRKFSNVTLKLNSNDDFIYHHICYNDNYLAYCDTYKINYSSLSKYKTINAKSFNHNIN